MAKPTTKNKYGQYFTPAVVAEFMVEMSGASLQAKILEPSCGEGVFLGILQDKGFTDITAYEIDNTLATQYSCVRYGSFVSADIQEKFDLIIGNPPYIRWKNLEKELKEELSDNMLWNQYFNSLCDYSYLFILKSIELLNEGGELIFICPEYWMNTTHAEALRNYMVQHGDFDQIYHFNETPIFSKATVSIVIFKYIKRKQCRRTEVQVAKYYDKQPLAKEILTTLQARQSIEKAEYLSLPQFEINTRWILQRDEIQQELKDLERACVHKNSCVADLLLGEYAPAYATIGDVCDIGNGMVSGLDKAFQLQEGPWTEKEKNATIEVLKAKNLNAYCSGDITPYLFIDEAITEQQLQENYPNFFIHLQAYKTRLEERYQYNKQIHYWEWVFLRNFKLFSRNERRIFVPCKERISNKNYFRFALVASTIFPTQDVTALFKKEKTRESLDYIVAYLNNYRIFNWLKCKGIVKGSIVEFSETPLASIPFRRIDWSDADEVALHDLIAKLTQEYLRTQEQQLLKQINSSFDKLFKG